MWPGPICRSINNYVVKLLKVFESNERIGFAELRFLAACREELLTGKCNREELR